VCYIDVSNADDREYQTNSVLWANEWDYGYAAPAWFRGFSVDGQITYDPSQAKRMVKCYYDK